MLPGCPPDDVCKHEEELVLSYVAIVLVQNATHERAKLQDVGGDLSPPMVCS